MRRCSRSARARSISWTVESSSATALIVAIDSMSSFGSSQTSTDRSRTDPTVSRRGQASAVIGALPASPIDARIFGFAVWIAEERDGTAGASRLAEQVQQFVSEKLRPAGLDHECGDCLQHAADTRRVGRRRGGRDGESVHRVRACGFDGGVPAARQFK